MKLVLTKKLRPNPDNPRFIKDEQFEKLKKSLEEFPEMLRKRPLVAVTVDDGFMVIGGNQRLAACLAVGLEKVPVELADDWTEEQRRQFVIKDNATYGSWDWDMLGSDWDLEKLDEWGVDVLDFGELDKVGMVNDQTATEWVGMPAFDPVEKTPKIVLHFKTAELRTKFALEQELVFTKKTTDAWSGWWPPQPQEDLASLRFDDG